MPQLSVFITFKVKPEKVEEWKEAHRPVWAACAKEPECLFFDIFEDPKEPGTFRFVEIWAKDQAWFEDEQMTKDYYKEMFPKSEPTWREPPKIEFFERNAEASIYRQEYLDGGRKMD